MIQNKIIRDINGIVNYFEHNLKEKRFLKDETGQTSAELMLLIGTILIIVLLVGVYVIHILNSIDNGLRNLVEDGRNFLINKL
jgi:Flp pilus assembly pilin Flp